MPKIVEFQMHIGEPSILLDFLNVSNIILLKVLQKLMCFLGQFPHYEHHNLLNINLVWIVQLSITKLLELLNVSNLIPLEFPWKITM